MSKKSKRRAAQKEAERIERMKRMAPKKKEPIKISKKTVIIASAIVFVLIASIIVGVVISIFSNRSFDYLSGDISDYVYISQSDYKNYELELTFDEVGESDVERKIMNLLYENRSENPIDNGAEKVSIPISVGDMAYVYFRGYTVDEDGEITEVSGTSNLFDSSPAKVNVGELGCVPGFEEGIIGAIPEQHRFELIKSGTVEPGDVIYVSYSVTYPDGSSNTKTNERIDLSRTDIDEKYGSGFKAYFEGEGADGEISKKQIGTKLDSVTFQMQNGSAAYFDMKVTGVTRCEENALTIDVHFPADYVEELLRGLDIKFDVFIDHTVVYTVPEYNEQFITETLKISAEDLAEYEGENLIEKHRAKLLAEAVEDNEEVRRYLIEEAMWEHYKEKAKIKKLPEKDVELAYMERMYELEYLASQYGYSDIGQFVCAYYGLSSTADWQATITEEVENVIAEKLIFYYIIRKENLLPTKAEYQQLYDAKIEELLEDYIEEEGYASELEKIEDEAKREKRTKEIESEMISAYGSDYLKEIIYYEFAYEDLIEFASVVEK